MREPNEVERAVMTEVCRAVGCEVAEALSKSRRPAMVDARTIFAVMMHARGVSARSIADLYGCQEQQVRFLMRRHWSLLKVDKLYRMAYDLARVCVIRLEEGAGCHISPSEG